MGNTQSNDLGNNHNNKEDLGKNQSKKEDYKWYFRAEENPFQDTADPEWAPYKIGDNATIEKAYINYSLSQGNWDGKVEIKDYEINLKDNYKSILRIIINKDLF